MEQTRKSNETGIDKDQGTAPGQLGTFAGVFTPSILTILGIILFLRLGYITGSGGVANTLLILGIANLVTIITSQSLAAIATNLKVKGGGDYYLISRTLGYKFGGAIGVVLYLAQSVSVAFYCIGFAEALTQMLGTSFPPSMIAAIAVSALFLLAWLGADWATKFQFVVMILLVLALGSFYLGGIAQWNQSIFLSNWQAPEGGPPFWVIFAIFFPAVTGFTQGVSMSGDLKDPGKSLPIGTFVAVGVSIAIYVSVILLFAGSLPNEDLMTDYQAMQRVSKYGFLIDAGVIAATLSSAMASFMGGPRILQSLAIDRIFPLLTFFAKGSGVTNNPRRAAALTGLIALFTINLGQLNLIAQVVSMFFLISYGLLNYATYFEADTGSTSFRPRFRFFNKYISLAGALLCLAILLALDVYNGLIALAIMFGIYLYLKNSEKPSRWADSSRSHAFSKVRKNLEQMQSIPEHQNDWYPHILAFTNHRDSREKLLQFGDLISGDTGLMTAVHIVGGVETPWRKLKKKGLLELTEDIADLEIFCFTKVITSNDFPTALPILLEAEGLGPLKANTVLLNWYNKPDQHVPGMERLKYGHNLRTCFKKGYNLVVFHCDNSKWQNTIKEDGKRDQIDIWWQDEDNNSKLMLLFSYLVTKNPTWKKAEIRVLTTGNKSYFSQAKEQLMQIFDEARIPAEPQLVDDFKPETVLAHSKDSSLVFLPFKIKQSRLTDVTGFSLERILPQLPPTALIMAAEEIDLDAEPEEGIAGELARAMDIFGEHEKLLRLAERQETKANEEVKNIRQQLRKEVELQDGTESISDEIIQLQKTLYEAEQAVEETFRKTAKTKAKYNTALENIADLGGSVENESRQP
ncbi:MAG: amino acid transporter [Desulforhopalus sp.]|jgi:amino acid transporter